MIHSNRLRSTVVSLPTSDLPEGIMLVVWLAMGKQSEGPVWCMSRGRAAESPLRVVKESVALNAWQVMTVDVHLLTDYVLNVPHQPTCVTRAGRVQVFISSPLRPSHLC